MNTISNLLAAGGLEYEEKIALLDESDFFRLFTKLNAEPRWTNANGKKSIQIIGHCHHGESHSALFDTSTLKVNCFSECGRGMLLHTWIKQALNMDNPQEAKDFIVEWIENEDIDLCNRTAQSILDFDYKERAYKPEHIEPIQAMPQAALDEVYANCDYRLETLNKLVWSTKSGILADILKAYDVAYHKINETIILPHHNINGEIVGLYERSFRPLRKDVKKDYPEVNGKDLLKYPRAKYVPLLKDEKYRSDDKTSWSFPNSQNLYGLHLAKEAIKETGIAIVFEGAKSVMLARQYGYSNAVATHTFGIHQNHISMLIECGAKEIILGFDKQYELLAGQAWELYEKKTKGIAANVIDYVTVSRLIDYNGLLQFKDAPIDKGKEILEILYNNREYLIDDNKDIALHADILLIPKREYEQKTDTEYTAQLEKEKQIEKEYKALAAKGQFLFGDLLIQRQKNSTSFLLLNEGNKEVTAYEIIKILSGNAFKSFKKKIQFKNNKIQMLPYSERYRIGFFFRQHYRKPPLLDNAETIATFINTAIKYTNNIELNQNWSACLDVTNTQEAAASLLAYYGWAAKYDEAFPRTENTFYTVDVRSGARHYNIVNDDITLRFAAIESNGRGLEAYAIIAAKELQDKDKYTKLQELLKPLLWRSNGVKMGLITEARELCDKRIAEYIENLLEHNAFDCIPLDEHINGVEIDKSDTGIVWAEPQQFTISMEDMEFLDYQYNIDADYNRKNNADKGKKKAYEKYSRLIGDEWNTAELKAQGYTPQQIINYCKYKWIEEVPEKKKGNLKYYRRILR